MPRAHKYIADIYFFKQWLNILLHVDVVLLLCINFSDHKSSVRPNKHARFSLILWLIAPVWPWNGSEQILPQHLGHPAVQFLTQLRPHVDTGLVWNHLILSSSCVSIYLFYPVFYLFTLFFTVEQKSISSCLSIKSDLTVSLPPCSLLALLNAQHSIQI